MSWTPLLELAGGFAIAVTMTLLSRVRINRRHTTPERGRQ